MYGNLRLFLSVLFQLLLVAFVSSGTYVGDSCDDAFGKQGTCQYLQFCNSAIERLKDGIKPKICSFIREDSIVCCANEDEATSPADIVASAMKPGDKAEKWCIEYKKSCPELLVGGDLADPKEFPHMAAIGYGPKDKILWSCGGTLVSEKFVLTAAHCMNSPEAGPVAWVLLATEVTRSATEQASPNARRGQTHPVIRRIRHPGYKPPAKYHDVALLEIGSALEPDALPLNIEELHPACLPIKWSSYTPVVIATGWGRVGYGEETSPDLLKVKINILDSAVCNESYKVEIRTTNKLSKGIDETMICAGVLEGGKDTCQGDSGGPLQVPIKNACMYEVRGITSFGKICGFANSPAVYMRVSEYVPWIEGIVWP